MHVTLQLVISHDDGHEETVTDVITLNKQNERIEHLGVSLAESKQLLSCVAQKYYPSLRDSVGAAFACRVSGRL